MTRLQEVQQQSFIKETVTVSPTHTYNFTGNGNPSVSHQSPLKTKKNTKINCAIL